MSTHPTLLYTTLHHTTYTISPLFLIGRSRLKSLKHPHEIITGKTSSISHQILGFSSSSSGSVINASTPGITSWEDICVISSKVVVFFDHPGKNLIKTLSGLTGRSPHYACLLISSLDGDVSLCSGDYWQWTLALRVPVIIILTKTGKCDTPFTDTPFTTLM